MPVFSFQQLGWEVLSAFNWSIAVQIIKSSFEPSKVGVKTCLIDVYYLLAEYRATPLINVNNIQYNNVHKCLFQRLNYIYRIFEVLR